MRKMKCKIKKYTKSLLLIAVCLSAMVNVNAIEKYPKKTLIEANFGGYFGDDLYSMIGITAGQYKRFGWYISGGYGCIFDGRDNIFSASAGVIGKPFPFFGFH